MTAKIPTISLFSGAGGLDIGFLKAGFDIRACVEIEPSYAVTLTKNVSTEGHFGDATQVLCLDVRDFDCTPYLSAGIECIIGGPPCQTFSAAGRRSGGVIGVDDERGQLFRAYCNILKQLKPAVFVFENVYGLPGANDGEPWREIITAFAAAGYELRAEVVDTADYGVPQHRERLIMVGYKTGDFTFPLPTHGPDSETSTPLVSVQEAIADLQHVDEPFQNGLGGMYGHLLPEVPEGLNYAYFTAEMGHPEPKFAWRSKFHDLLYKVKRDEPCRTIKAQPGKFTGPFHWKNRHFTVSELKRLQTFPDDYEIVGRYGKIVEQIGNSVPPQLAHAIAASVRDQLLRPTKNLEYAVRHAGFASTFRQRQRERSKAFKVLANEANRNRAHVAQRPLQSAGYVEQFVVNPKSLFDRTRQSADEKSDNRHPTYKVRVVEDEAHIDIHLVKEGLSRVEDLSTISITGLRKYLPDYDTCTLLAEIDSVPDIFHAWNVIEDVLISRSRFFTLIDIYGHYANKGDAVSVKSDLRFSKSTALVRLLNRFGSTLDCGDFVGKKVLQRELEVSEEELARCVADMRSTRFDIRSSETHPIIGPERVLCTYPFPLLSPRALVESRARVMSSVSAAAM